MGNFPEQNGAEGDRLRIPLSFDEAIEGLLRVKPEKKERKMSAAELRKKIARKEEIIREHSATTDSIHGDDKPSRAARRYHQGMARRAAEEKAEFEAELDKRADEAE